MCLLCRGTRHLVLPVEGCKECAQAMRIAMEEMQISTCYCDVVDRYKSNCTHPDCLGLVHSSAHAATHVALVRGDHEGFIRSSGSSRECL
jgi:hypothetical protein